MGYLYKNGAVGFGAYADYLEMRIMVGWWSRKFWAGKSTTTCRFGQWVQPVYIPSFTLQVSAFGATLPLFRPLCLRSLSVRLRNPQPGSRKNRMIVNLRQTGSPSLMSLRNMLPQRLPQVTYHHLATHPSPSPPTQTYRDVPDG